MTKKKPGPRRTSGRRGAPARRARADDMLANALRLFAEIGYANATVKSIAAAAGINPALLYYYYESKEALFIATLRQAIAAALDDRAGFDLIARTTDSAALIRAWFEKNRSLIVPLSQMLKLLLEYRTSGTRIPEVDRLIRRFYDAELELLSRAIQRGMRSGQFRADIDVQGIASFVSTHLDGLVLGATIRGLADIRRGLSLLEAFVFEHLRAPDRRFAIRRKRGAQLSPSSA
ncbi:MAG: TetR/AcrR family transcriptional regulator [Alphaproteobacteria bacterium]|nr:TetR/AcrR family transcriptional regulator [Alphaproteobacteria bacterium]